MQAGNPSRTPIVTVAVVFALSIGAGALALFDPIVFPIQIFEPVTTYDLNFQGFCFADIPASADPLRVLRYFRGTFLAYEAALRT